MLAQVGDRTRQRKKTQTFAGIEPTNPGFDRPLLYRLSHKARRAQLVGYYQYGGNCGNVNVKGICDAIALRTKHSLALTAVPNVCPNRNYTFLD